MNLGLEILGTEYRDSICTNFGDITVTNLVEIREHADDSLILKPGGYIITYRDGFFMRNDGSPICGIGGAYGPMMRWRSVKDSRWLSASFAECENVDHQKLKDTIVSMDAEDLAVILDLTVPHYLNIQPAEGVIGSVIVNVLRYTPFMKFGV